MWKKFLVVISLILTGARFLRRCLIERKKVVFVTRTWLGRLNPSILSIPKKPQMFYLTKCLSILENYRVFPRKTDKSVHVSITMNERRGIWKQLICVPENFLCVAILLMFVLFVCLNGWIQNSTNYNTRVRGELMCHTGRIVCQRLLNLWFEIICFIWYKVFQYSSIYRPSTYSTFVIQK